MRVPAGGSGGAAAYGFEVPTGDPAELDGAAGRCADWASALTGRAGAVRTGAATASAGWSGSAEGSFAAYASHVEHIYSTLGDTVAAASRALSKFAGELETAQKATGRALSECESLSGQVTSAQTEAAAHAQTVQSLSTQLASTVHPAQHAELSRQLSEAQGNQHAAEQAASRAQGALEAAERRGQQAWSTYQQQAHSASQAIQGLSAQIVKVEGLPAAAHAGAKGAPGAKDNFFWPTLGGAIGAPETDAGMGLAEGLLKRYRKTELVVPITEDARGEMETFAERLGPDGPAFVEAGTQGLVVPAGSSADPTIEELRQATSTNQFTQPNKGVVVPGEDDIEGAAPEWSSIAGKSLGYADVGLTLWSTGAEQWEYDSEHHPGWSTTEKVIDSGQTAAVVGGSEAGGAWIVGAQGAEDGAEAGFAIGEMIDPLGGGIVGGVIGGLAGGIAGGLVGGEIGKKAGEAVETIGHAVGHVAGDVGHVTGDVGHDIGHTAKHIWDSIF